jgi:predicted  nucleic acid-binding Zn-ribbon protein
MKTEFERTLAQRNKATACAVLSIVISLALVMGNFRSYRKDLTLAHSEILDLQRELIGTQKALKENEEEILRLQSALRKTQGQ